MPEVEHDPQFLDTNILIHATRGSVTWQRIKAAYSPLTNAFRPLYSVVTEGELRSFAEQRGWGTVRRNQMEFLLGYFKRVEIGTPEVLRAYALIDAYSHQVSGIKMGKNDLWIAASANVTGAALLMTDKDFDHIHGAILTRVLIEP